MSNFVQDDRPIGVETTLGTDTLVLASFRGEERMSGLFSFQLEMLSNEESIAPDSIVGKPIDFYVLYPDGEKRYFNGFVNRFGYAGGTDRGHLYHAHVVPWLWFLTKGSDCREHESDGQQSAKDIIDALFNELGYTDFKWDLKREPAKRNYCVQYRETHFEFVTRLMAEEGIFYYFKHEQGKHELVMTDHIDGVFECTDSEVRLLSNLSQPELTDNLREWDHEYEFTTGKFTHTDYDFENPSSSLQVKKDSLVSLPGNSGLEYYDHPGRYVDKGLGDNLAQLRMEEEESGYDIVTGSSVCRSFSPGGKFSVTEHHNEGEKGGKWVLTVVEHSCSQGGSYVSGVQQADEIYSNRFRCIPAETVFRPPHQSKPQIHGLQSAVVVGPAGEEIHTDKHGRIKIQYHWDRKDGGDDKSSFWVRVMTPWAGSNWGMIHIPRVGQEVIISFLEGDPDRPIVAGMLFNNENMPPYSLPDNKTQSGIKTRSSKGGADANFNEIRFEDKLGSEEVYIHAEKDQTIMVENNLTETVGNDETQDVANNRTRSVGSNETVTVNKLRIHTVGINETISVGAAQQVTVGAVQTISVGLNQSTSVGVSQSNDIGANQSTEVGKNQSTEVGKNQSVEVGDDQTTKVGKNQTITIGENQTIKVGKKLAIEAGDEVSIVTGKAKLVMKKDGTIQISGKDISVDASGKINVKASKDIVMKGKKILQN